LNFKKKINRCGNKKPQHIIQNKPFQNQKGKGKYVFEIFWQGGGQKQKNILCFPPKKFLLILF